MDDLFFWDFLCWEVENPSFLFLVLTTCAAQSPPFLLVGEANGSPHISACCWESHWIIGLDGYWELSSSRHLKGYLTGVTLEVDHKKKDSECRTPYIEYHLLRIPKSYNQSIYLSSRTGVGSERPDPGCVAAESLSGPPILFGCWTVLNWAEVLL